MLAWRGLPHVLLTVGAYNKSDGILVWSDRTSSRKVAAGKPADEVKSSLFKHEIKCIFRQNPAGVLDTAGGIVYNVGERVRHPALGCRRGCAPEFKICNKLSEARHEGGSPRVARGATWWSSDSRTAGGAMMMAHRSNAAHESTQRDRGNWKRFCSLCRRPTGRVYHRTRTGGRFLFSHCTLRAP